MVVTCGLLGPCTLAGSWSRLFGHFGFTFHRFLHRCGPNYLERPMITWHSEQQTICGRRIGERKLTMG